MKQNFDIFSNNIQIAKAITAFNLEKKIPENTEKYLKPLRQILKSKMERTSEDLENIREDAVEKISTTIKTLNERVRCEVCHNEYA